MRNRDKLRLSNRRIKNATKQDIAVVDAEVVNPEEVVVKKRGRPRKIRQENIDAVVPFYIASRLNRDINIANEQRNLRKVLSAFLRERFDDFLEDFKNLSSEPALRARIFVEIMKIVLPRQREADDREGESERDKFMKKFFGNQEQEK